jgi:tRNA (guanine10-N2)-methyltransferase
LLTCAHYGAYTLGCDIDVRQLKGLTKMKTRTHGVQANVAQYGLEKWVLDTVVCDHSRHPFREAEIYDAIVTDRILLLAFY